MVERAEEWHCTKNDFFHQGFLQLMWPNPQETVDLVTLTEEILDGKLDFLERINAEFLD